MVFLGKGVEIQATPELSTMEIGRWVHIGDKNTIRCHEGSLRIGDKVVLGRDNVINTYLDIELGDSVLMADWCYVCDFDHRMDSIELPIKDQGIVKGPVRIGPDTWVATKVTVLRGTTIGRGCVLGSHAVVKGDIPDFSIAVGAPAKVVKNRKLAWETSAAERAELAAALADIERKKAVPLRLARRNREFPFTARRPRDWHHIDVADGGHRRARPAVAAAPNLTRAHGSVTAAAQRFRTTRAQAEYKQVTVLFADVVHSMDIAAAVGAERLREIMTELFDRSSAAVRALRRDHRQVHRRRSDGGVRRAGCVGGSRIAFLPGRAGHPPGGRSASGEVRERDGVEAAAAGRPELRGGHCR